MHIPPKRHTEARRDGLQDSLLGGAEQAARGNETKRVEPLRLALTAPPQPVVDCFSWRLTVPSAPHVRGTFGRVDRHSLLDMAADKI